jgi:ribosome-associated translation inhibitor RaiA
VANTHVGAGGGSENRIVQAHCLLGSKETTLQVPLQLTFRHMDPSPAVEERVRELVEKLDGLYDRITSCRVVIDAPHHKTHGDPFGVRISVTVPEREIHVSTDRAPRPDHDDVYVAIRDGFDAVKRQLKNYAGTRQAVRS